MQFYKQNSIKHNFFRAIAVMITLCYILGLAQLPIKSVLHTISHNFEIPSYVLQHDEADNSDYAKQLSLGTNAGNHNLNHQHKVLDFLEVIFDEQSNGNENHSGETTIVDLKINKHITNKKYKLIFAKINYLEKPSYWLHNQFEMKGYLNKLYRPPQV
ncbi:hypothetical protein [Winogradskyella sp. R77965]|uniref:hypothetical protein n=1 Tax=Winogradskyella sp. R77965 TaxID=3093872 RepID=UPI0037DC0D2C